MKGGPFLIIYDNRDDSVSRTREISLELTSDARGLENCAVEILDTSITKRFGWEENLHAVQGLQVLAYLADTGDGHEGLSAALKSLLGQAFNAGRRFQDGEKRRKRKTPLPPRE